MRRMHSLEIARQLDVRGQRRARHCCGSAAIAPQNISSNTAVTPTRNSIRMISPACRAERRWHAARSDAIGESQSKVNAKGRI